jgi:Tol biopolymer transport system component
MTQRGDVDKLITTWLQSDADGTVPSYLDETLQLLDRTARPRRPGWWQRLLAVEGPVFAVPRPVFQLALIALLTLAALAAALIVGSQRRPAPPIGPAGNGQIAYSDGRTLYLLDLDGRRVQSGFFGIGYETNPSISPDGTRIAWLSRKGSDLGAQRVFVAPLDGSSPPLDVSGGLPAWSLYNSDVQPAWSPDGTELAYTGLEVKAGSVGVVVTRADGAGGRFVISGGPGADYLQPRWSPDGRWISVGAMDTSQLEGTVLIIVRPDGSDPRELARAETRSDSFADLSWSPDGTRVVYSRRDSLTPGEYRVAVLNIATLVETPLSPPGRFGFVPTWSTDGRSVAYFEASGPDARPHTIVVDVAGESRPRDLGFVIDCTLAWSPDSRFLIGHTTDGCNDAFAVVPVDDPGARTLVAAPGANGRASWQRVAP